ncbi:MAG: hypothetical protein CVU64_16680 [Deltaproteobacteria bacterium HGW-Deltaproteobacteria-21]|nr:MAG: hypothetical protein CVU64_16680 [Deltaproteobacteria bacterium HGW-Deltaproteobacteria-21]
MKQDKRENLNKLIAPRRGEVYGADKPEYWNVGIVEYWGTTTKSLEMRVPQNGFLTLNPSFHHSIIPSFHNSKMTLFRAEPMVSDMARRTRFSSMQ